MFIQPFARGQTRKLQIIAARIGGAAQDEEAAIGRIAGPGFAAHEVPDAIERVVGTYLELRRAPEESFIEAYRRLGDKPFKERLYAAAQG